MQKTDDMPIWVFLALSSIETRKGALILVRSCLLFMIYCIPWVHYYDGNGWVAKVFLLEDWSWFAMMPPMTLWYWLSLRWVDKNSGWRRTQNA